MNNWGVLWFFLINVVVSEDTAKLTAAPTHALFATSIEPSPMPDGPCFLLELFDSQGDGWNGAHYYFRSAAGDLVAQGTLDAGDGTLPPKTRRLEEAEQGSNDDDMQTHGEGSGDQHVQRQICVPDVGCYSYNVTSGTAPDQIQWEIGDTFSGGAPYGPKHFYVFASGAVDQACDPGTPTSQPSHVPSDFPLTPTVASMVSTAAPTVTQSLGLTMSPSLVPTLSPKGPCFILVLIDDFGDGWNGAQYSILSMSEEIVAQGTLEDGDGSFEPYGGQEQEEIEQVLENVTDDGNGSLGGDEVYYNESYEEEDADGKFDFEENDEHDHEDDDEHDHDDDEEHENEGNDEHDDEDDEEHENEGNDEHDHEDDEEHENEGIEEDKNNDTEAHHDNEFEPYYYEGYGLQEDQRRICLPEPGCYTYSVTPGGFPDEIKWEMGDSALSGGAPYPARDFYVFANGGLESSCNVSATTSMPSILPHACPSTLTKAPTTADVAVTIEPTAAPTIWPTPVPTVIGAVGPTLALTLEPTEATSLEPTPGPAQDKSPGFTLEPSQGPTHTYDGTCFILMLTDSGNDGWNGAQYEFFDENEELILHGTLKEGDGEVVHYSGSDQEEAKPLFNETVVNGSYDGNKEPNSQGNGLQQDQRRVCMPAPGCYFYRVTPGERADEIRWEIGDRVLMGGAPFGPREIFLFENGALYNFCNASLPTLPPSRQSVVSPTQVQSLTPTRNPTEQPTPRPSAIPTLALDSTHTTPPSLSPSTTTVLTLPSAPPTSIPTHQSSVFHTSMPTPQPSPCSTSTPAALPHVQPTIIPHSTTTSVPSVFPSSQPLVTSSVSPTSGPSFPQSIATPVPSVFPSPQPFVASSPSPTSAPSLVLTSSPSPPQSSMPAAPPSNRPTNMLTSIPTLPPSIRPTYTKIPLPLPSIVPSVMPTACPTADIHGSPMSNPTPAMSGIPTFASSFGPTLRLTSEPSLCPTYARTFLPSYLGIPSSIPDTRPSSLLTAPTSLSTSPSLEPQTASPTITPTVIPSNLPKAPTNAHSYNPTSVAPSVPASSIAPSTYAPSAHPSFGATTSKPFSCPSIYVSEPTESPIRSPLTLPTIAPSIGPSTPASSVRPTYSPSLTPSTNVPSALPTTAGGGGVIIVETPIPTTDVPSLIYSSPLPSVGVSSYGPSTLPSAIPRTAAPLSPSSVEPSSSEALLPSPSSATAVPSSLLPSFPHSTLPATLPPTVPPTVSQWSPPSFFPSLPPTLQSPPPLAPSVRPTLGQVSPSSSPPSFPPTLPLSSSPSSQPSFPPTLSMSSPSSLQPSLPPAWPLSSPLPTSLPPTFQESFSPSVFPSPHLSVPLPSNMPMAIPYSVPSLASPSPSGMLPTALSTVPTVRSPSSSRGIPSAVPSIAPHLSIQTLGPSVGPPDGRSAQPTLPPNNLPSHASSPMPTVLDGGQDTWPSPRPSSSSEASRLPSVATPSSQPTGYAPSALNVGVASTIVLNGLTEEKFGETEVGYFNDGLSNSLSFGDPEVRDTNAVNLTITSRRLIHTVLGGGPRRRLQVRSFIAVSFVLVYPGINATNPDFVSHVRADLERAVMSNNGSSSPLEVNIKLAAGGTSSPLASVSVDEDFSLISISEDTKAVPIATSFPTTSSSSPSLAISISPSPLPSILPTAHSTVTPTMKIVHETIAPSQSASVSPSPTIAPSLFSCEKFLYWKTAPAPPKLLDAQFTSSGAHVYVNFDSPTNRGGRLAGSLFSCGELFQFDDADVSSCLWINTTTVDVDVSNSLSFQPGSNVTVYANLLKAACVHSVVECECYEFTNSSIAIAAKAPAEAIVPTAVLQGPYSTSVCENVTWSADQSTGSGGRPMTYIWSIAVPQMNTSNNVTSFSDDTRSSAEAFMASIVANSQGKPFFTLPEAALSRLILFGTQLELALVLKNLFGATSSSSYIISLEYDQIPSLVIIGGRQLSLSSRSESLAVEAEGYATACDGRPDSERTVNFNWVLLALDGASLIETTYVSLAKNDRFFELAPYTLDSNSSYVLRATVIDHSIPTNKNTVDIYIQIGIGVVVAAIDGGTTQAASTSKPITLSALDSYDQDDPTATLAFQWSCSQASIHVNGTECTSLIIDRSSGILEIAPNELQAGIYIFTVNVIAHDGRLDTAETTVTLIDAPLLPRIELSSIQDAVSAAEKLTIAARISVPLDNVSTALSATSLASSWSLTGGDLAEDASLSTVVRTPLSVSTAILGNASRTHYLVIQPYSLVPGGVYSFQLEATASGASSTTSLEVTVYAPPTAGSLHVTPTAGMAFYTLFQLRAPGWVSSSLPLQYSFHTDSGTILHTSSPNTVLEGARLPPGVNPPNLKVTVVVTDGIGAYSEASMVVQVYPLPQQNAVIENDVTAAISTGFARYSLDEICQIVAATAENSNASLIDTLTAALASAINVYVDPVLEHLEQSIGAALALTKGALHNGAAQDTLDILNGLTETLAKVEHETSGDDNTVQYVAESLSNLLQSGLFISTDAMVSGTRRLNLGSNTSKTSQVFLDTIDALTQAQRLTIVDNEKSVGFKTKNLASASQKISNDLGWGAKTIAIANMNASASILLDDGVSYSSSLTEFRINPRRLDGSYGDDALSPVVRFKLNKSDTSNTFFSNKVNLTIPGSPTLSKNGTNASVECECGFKGYKSIACADAIRRVWCDGTPGIFFPCNSTRIACAIWDEDSRLWVVPPYCETIELAGSTRCNCQINSNSDSADYSTREEFANTVQLYTQLFQTKPGFRRSRLVFFVCLTLLVVVIIAAFIGEYMDRRNKEIRTYSSRGLRPMQHHSLPSLPSHAVSISEIDTPTMHVLARRRVTLISEEAKTVAQIFIRAHPMLNWWHIYSPTSSRKVRALKLGVEMVTLFLALTVEIAFVEFPPADCDKYDEEYACENRDLSVGSRKPLCDWDVCSNRCVKRDVSDAAQNISHFIMLLITLAIGIPIFAVMDWLIDDYINAPLPHAIRLCFTGGEKGDNVRVGAPQMPDCVARDSESETPNVAEPAALACVSAPGDDATAPIGSESEIHVDRVVVQNSTAAGDIHEDIESQSDIRIKLEEDLVNPWPPRQGRLESTDDGVSETKKQDGASEERSSGHQDLSGAAVNEEIEDLIQDKEPVTDVPRVSTPRGIHVDEVSNAPRLSNAEFAIAFAQGVSGSKGYEESEMPVDSEENTFTRRTTEWTVFVSRCLLALEGARRDLALDESEDSENVKRSSQGNLSFDVIKHRVRHAVVKKRNPLRYMASKHAPSGSPGADLPRGNVRRQASRDVHNVAREVLRNMRLCLEELRAYRRFAADSNLSEGVALLDEIELFYKREWGWVADSTLWRLNVEAMLRIWMRDAFKLQRDLKKLRRNTTRETMLLRMERVLEAEKAARLSRVERNIYESTIQRLDDLQRRRRTTPPTLPAYITTWIVILGIIGAVVVFMLQVATKLGADRSRHWLVAMLVTVVLYYAIIVPIEIVFFDIVLPNLVVDRMRRISNLSEDLAFPFSATFPTSPVYFLCLLEPSYASTRLGRHTLGRALLNVFPVFYAHSASVEEKGKLDPWQQSCGRDSESGVERSVIEHKFFTENLSQIHANVTWQPPPRVRAGLKIASVLLALPPALHKPIFEEVVLAVSLFGAVAMSWLVSAIYDTQQETISEAIFLVFIVFSLIAIAILGHSVVRVHGATVSCIPEKRAQRLGAN